MTLTIRAKVILATVLPVLLGLFVAGWFALRTIEQRELTLLADDLEARTALALVSLEPLVLHSDQDAMVAGLQAEVRALARQADGRLSVIAADGRVLADSAVPTAAIGALRNQGAHAEVRDAMNIGQGMDLRISEVTGQRLLHVALPFGSDDTARRGVVRLAIPFASLDAHSADLRQNLGAALALAFACSLLLGWLLARGLTRPLSEMAGVARQLADGSLTQRIRTTGQDEVGILGATFNRMADQLENTIRDVTEDRAQLRATLTAMVEGVMVVDSRGTVLEINPALERMLMAPTINARGRPHWEMIRHHELNNLVSGVLKSRQNTNGEIVLAPGDRTFQVQASVAGGERPNEACAVLVFHDVTTLRRLEKVRKDFVANVSHELRTPLTSIHGYAQALRDVAANSPDEAVGFVDTILKQSDRLNLIIDDLLQLSHIESGEVVFRKEPVSLSALGERALAVIKPQAEKKGHRLVLSIPPDLPSALADEERLLQALTNLLDNAVKYTPEGGTIEVSGRKLQQDGSNLVELTVSDSGLGIPEPDRPRVFERFYRVDKARSREMGGTGLGLSIVKHIVEGHQGRVWVEGNQPVGSRFVIRLPAAGEQDSQPLKEG